MDMVTMIINMDDMEAMEDMATDMVQVMGEVMAMVEDMTTIKDMVMHGDYKGNYYGGHGGYKGYGGHYQGWNG